MAYNSSGQLLGNFIGSTRQEEKAAIFTYRYQEKPEIIKVIIASKVVKREYPFLLTK